MPAKSRYPFDTLGEGESFVADDTSRASMTQLCLYHGRRLGRVFTCEYHTLGLLVVREADRAAEARKEAVATRRFDRETTEAMRRVARAGSAESYAARLAEVSAKLRED